MANYKINYGCGHNGSLNIVPRNKTNPGYVSWRIDQAESGDCPDCWKKNYFAKKDAEPLFVVVHDIMHNEGSPEIEISITGSSYGVKDRIKALGFRWDYPTDNFLTFLSRKYDPPKEWVKKVNFDNLEKILDGIKEEFKDHKQGMKIEMKISPFVFKGFENNNTKKNEAEKEAK